MNLMEHIAMPTDLKPKTLLSANRARELEKLADTLAEQLASSEDLTKAFESAVEIDFTNKLTTAKVHFSLMGMFDDEAELEGWPVVGSLEGYTDNKPFDIFRYKDAEGKEQQGSYWRMVANHHPVGIALNKKKQAIIDGGKDGVKNEYTDLSDGDRERMKADQSGKFSTFYGKLKFGVQLYHKMTDANARLKTVVDVDYDRKVVMDGKKPKVADGEVVTEINTESPRIICVSDKARKGVAKYFTIPNFLRLDVDLAIAAGGTYADFISSNKRGEDGEEDNEDIKENPVKIVHPVDFENVIVQALHYMNAVKASVASHRGLLAFFNAAGSDDRLQTLFQFADVLTILTGNKTLKDRVEALDAGTDTPEQAAEKVAARTGGLTQRKAA